ncbi:unnamed protein product [Hymenolepis diminuta]|uniref:Uncharacterized protein n=1 Tax=Hymenolepis diminuta TaxID=6216 RepID=A0A0R3S884_HYMDI|nr:unnamed protein product [Hymenolepis diminuta]VUZ52581.1 unnamed protein product [Hymenolepis diminuta]
MDEERGQSIGIFVFLILLLVAHVACWIASVVKAAMDRKAITQMKKAAKSEPLLDGVRKKEEEEKKRQSLTINVDDSGNKFAIRETKTQSSSPASPNNPSEHHFPKCPKRHLSTGGAKRISPEELALMLDNYAPKQVPNLIDPSVIPSPTRIAAKGITTVNA